MQTVNYSYNIQGQLKSISSPVFTEELFYDDNTNGNPLYNGSIASITYNGNSSYRFSYDGLNRLKESVYGEQNNEGNNGLFSEYIDSYDKNGNILGLTRSGMSRDLFNMENGVAPLVKNNIDQLIMGYNGNQIKSVKDNNNTEQYLSVGMGDFADKQNTENPDDDEYKYDYNGNCIADLNKGIAWTSYNYLDRPQTVQMINGNKISYGYDASGTKKWTEYYWAEEPLQIPLGNTEMVLSPENVDRYSRTDYCGRYIYIDGALSRILVPEGYVQVTGLDATNWSYAYNIVTGKQIGRAHV